MGRERERESDRPVKGSGASKRLRKVYSKIQAWEWLSGEFEVAIMLDKDLYITQAIDDVFYKLSHCMLAGVLRGRGDFPLNRPRHLCTTKTKKGISCYRRSILQIDK